MNLLKIRLTADTKCSSVLTEDTELLPGDRLVLRTGDALALTLRHQTGRVFRLVSLEAAAGLGDERSRARYVNGILTWCSTRPAGLTVLAGPMEVDAETDSRLDQRFIGVGAVAEGPRELRIEPKSTRVVRAARAGQASVAGVDSTPLLVDVPSP